MVCRSVILPQKCPKIACLWKNMSKINRIIGGGGEIRTLEAFRLTHFPGVLLRPLGHSTATINPYTWSFKAGNFKPAHL